MPRLVGRNGGFPRRMVRPGYIAAATAIVMAAVWFYTPIPTTAARYAWERFHSPALALALNRTDADLAFSLGAYYFGNQSMIGAAGARPYELGKAEYAFKKALALAPTMPLAHYMLARIEFVHSNFTAALAELNEELSVNPAYTRALYMRALTYAYRGRPGDLSLAEADFRSFIAWAPGEWAGYNDLAYVLAKEKKYEEAATVLADGIAHADGGGTNPWLWNSLGVMELDLGKFSGAVSAFLKAQTLAASLTETDWQRAYPGNDPKLAAGGLEAMRSGIEKNLATARAALGK